MPLATFSETAGSMKLAVPISMAEAPARKNSTASVALEIPPKPTTGIFTALATKKVLNENIGDVLLKILWNTIFFNNLSYNKEKVVFLQF